LIVRRYLLALSALLLLCGSCSRRPSIVVTLPNVPQDAASLTVMISKDPWTPQGGATPSSEQPSFDLSSYPRSGEFSYRFGLHPPIGTSSRLAVGVGVFNKDGCLITTGNDEVTLSDTETDQDLRINLEPPPLEYVSACRKETPVVRAAVQTQADAYKLTVSGWGFHPRAQLLLDGTPLSPTQWAWNSITVPLPNLNAPTGVSRVTLTVKNPDGTQANLRLVLNTLTFASPLNNTYSIALGRDAKSMAVADVNKDGAPDVVVGGTFTNGTKGFVGVFLNLGGGRFQVQPDYYDFDGSGETVVATDFNGDSLPDIAISSKSTNTVVVMYNDGRGKFPPLLLKRVPGGSSPDQMASGDIDGDGKVDLVTVGNQGSIYALFLLFNEGAQFSSSDPDGLLLLGRIPTDMAFEDVNGDGKPDWVIADIRPGNAMAGEPQVVSEVAPIYNKWPNPPDPFISYLTAGSLGRVGIGDLNGDGLKDVIVTGAYVGGQQVDNNKLTLLFNLNGTLLQQPRTEVVTVPRPFALAMADSQAN
jgi:hypothetical protein